MIGEHGPQLAAEKVQFVKLTWPAGRKRCLLSSGLTLHTQQNIWLCGVISQAALVQDWSGVISLLQARHTAGQSLIQQRAATATPLQHST